MPAASVTGPMRSAVSRADSGSVVDSPNRVWPGATRSMSVPRASSSASRSARLDAEIPTTATIAAMPMAIPSAVSAVRSGRDRSPIVPTRSRSRPCMPARREPSAARCTPSRRRDVVDDPAVEQGDPPGGAGRDLAVVGDQDDRPPARVEVGEQPDDGLARAAVEVARSARRRARSPGHRPAPGRWRHAGARRRTARRDGGRRARRARRRPAPRRRRARRRRLGTPAYSSPSATFSSADSPSTRWNCWKTNPIRRPRTAARRASRSALDVVTVDAHGARRRSLQGADDVDQRRLAGSGRSDDDDELAGHAPSGRCRRGRAPAGSRSSAW